MKTGFLIASVISYLIASVLPAYTGESQGSKYQGSMCLFFGWLSILYNYLMFLAWFANIPFFISILMYWYNKSKTTMIILLILAIGLGALAFTVKKILINEAGTETTVSIGLAVYFWLASFIILLVGALFLK
jgi:hypothetical protein